MMPFSSDVLLCVPDFGADTGLVAVIVAQTFSKAVFHRARFAIQKHLLPADSPPRTQKKALKHTGSVGMVHWSNENNLDRKCPEFARKILDALDYGAKVKRNQKNIGF
jgi:hypothetical protein